jgi:predicted site-specific integrase-resolvase
MSEYLSERKAAAMLGISRVALRKYRKQGLIKPLVIGYAVLYSQSALNEWQAKYIVQPGKPIRERKIR